MVFIVQHSDHAVGIGKSCFIESLAAPLIFFPIEPVLYYVINLNFFISELIDHVKYFLLRFVSLAALLEAEAPFLKQGGLAC